MSRVLQPTVPQQGPVLPGTQVITQLPMATAINTGDYVYATSTGYGVAASTGGIIYSKIPMSGTYATGYVQSGSLPGYQYGPVAQIGTYSGTTYTAGQLVTTATQVNNVSNATQLGTMAALANGNFVFVYRTAANNFSFKILNTAGSTITGATVIGTDVNQLGQNQYLVISPLAAGGFVIAYYPTAGSALTIKKYASDGTLSTTASMTLSSAATNWSMLNFFELSNGSYAFVGADQSSTTNAYYAILDSSFAFVKSLTTIDTSSTYYGNISTTYYLNACALYGGSFALSWYAPSASQHCLNVFSNTGSPLLTTTPLNNNTYAGSTGSFTAFSICPTADGGFAIAYYNNNTGFMGYARYVVGSTITCGSSSYGSTGIGSLAFGAGYRVNIFPVQGDLLGIYYYNTSNYPSLILASASSSTTTTWGTAILLNGSNASTMYQNPNIYCCAPTGKAAFHYASATFPTMTSVSSLAVTNGTTYSGLSFSPPSYYFLGVAVNSASAGQTANVVINGAATVNSNYPSLTSVAPFDFSGTGPFGNIGTVYGRTVNMKGLE